MKKTVVIFLVALVLGGLAAYQGETEAAPRTGPPIKVGVLVGLSSFVAPIGEHLKQGIEIALDEVGRTIAGRRVEVIYEDEQGVPGASITKARKLVEQDGAHALLVGTTSPELIAIRDYVVQRNIPVIGLRPSAPSLREIQWARNIFFATFRDDRFEEASARLLFERLPHRKVILVGFDYSGGLTHVDAFEKAFTQAGGSITGKILIPLGTADPSPYVAKIDPKQADAVVAILWGADAIRFTKTFAEYGLMKRIPFIPFGGGIMQPYVRNAVNVNILNGVISYQEYAESLDSPENKKLREKVKQRYQDVVSGDAALGYTAARALIEALKKINGDVENVPRLLQALKQVEFESPAGPFRFDERNQAVKHVYLEKFEVKGGVGAQVLLGQKLNVCCE